MIISTFYNHGNAIGGEFDLLVRVEVGDGLHQADAAHLEQVVGTFSPFVEPLDDAQHQPQVALNQLFPGFFVAGFGEPEQCVHFCVGQGAQSGGVHAADFYFSLHGVLLLLGDTIISSRRTIIHGGRLWYFHKNRRHQIRQTTAEDGAEKGTLNISALFRRNSRGGTVVT